MVKYDKAVHLPEAMRRHEAGESVKAIARSIGVNYSTLHASIKKFGKVTNRTFGQLHGKDEQLATDYESGLTLEAIGNKHGVSAQAVYYRLKKMGCKMRFNYEYDHSVFDDPLTDEAKYWAGFIMADGCVYNHSRQQVGEPNSLKVALHGQDVAHLEKLKLFFKSDRPVRVEDVKPGGMTPNGTTRCVFTISSERACASLGRLGIVARKSLIAEAHESLVRSPDFWRGMIDGDGTVAFGLSNVKCPNPQRVPQILLTGGSRKIMEQLRTFITEVAKLPEPLIRGNKTGRYFRVSLTCSKAFHLVRLLYGDRKTSLDRKQATADTILREYIPANNRDWSHLTLEVLESEKAALGTWAAVGQKYGTDSGTVATLYFRHKKKRESKTSVG